jgi:type I restriction enzyme M protein
MILNGDGRTNIREIDSIENHDKSNNFFQFCLTNPPFGQDTIWDKDINTMKYYQLGYKYAYNKNNKIIKTDEKIRQQLGILFIERSMNLLRNGSGILEIILPNGYLTNPSIDYIAIRNYLFENYRIVASILLPEDSFSKSGASGFPVILIVKKEKVNYNYKIFTAVARNIGFNHTSIKVPKIFIRDKNTGEYVLDINNEKIPKDDLLLIAKKFKKFAFDNDLSEFEQDDNKEDYSYTTRDQILKDKNLILCAKRSDNEYINLLKKIKQKEYTTLQNIGADVTNKLSYKKEPSTEYIYLDTGELFTGYYKKRNKLMGWELPNRAKQGIIKNDILVAKTRGCFDNFWIILEDNSENIVATNGFWRIRIADEKQRLNFYSYLFTEDYKKQMETLATGTLLTDVKEEDLIEKLFIPTNKIEKNYEKMKKFLAVQKELYSSL